MDLSAARVGLRCDAGPAIGVGHAVRLLALAQELQHRGAHVTLLGSLDVPWVRAAYDGQGIAIHSAEPDSASLTAQARALGLHAIVLDGYALDPSAGAALSDAGLVVLAMVDGDFGAGQHADVYVDQNLGSQPSSALPAGAVALAGIEHALFRDSVLAHRDAHREAHDPTRVLAVFGGTDPYGAAAVITPLLLATGAPLEVTVVAPDPDVRSALAALPVAAGQHVHAVGPVSDLPTLAVSCDLAISASGSSVWELLCLGLPTAVVCVVDNQRLGYLETVGQDVVAGLGMLEDLRSDADARARVVDLLTVLVTDPAARDGLASKGRSLVDGRGRVRVADALQRALAAQHFAS